MKLVDIVKTHKQMIYCYRGFFFDYILRYDFKNVYQKIIVTISLLRARDLYYGPFYVVNPNKFKKEINKFIKDNELSAFVCDFKLKLNRYNRKKYDFYIEEGSKIYIYNLKESLQKEIS